MARFRLAREDDMLAIDARVSGLENAPITPEAQAALDLKAPAANPVFTGTVTVPDSALSIADTNGLQTALDGSLPVYASTITASQTIGSTQTCTTFGTVTITSGTITINGGTWYALSRLSGI